MQQINITYNNNNNCIKYCNVYRKLPDNYDPSTKVQESFPFPIIL